MQSTLFELCTIPVQFSVVDRSMELPLFFINGRRPLVREARVPAIHSLRRARAWV